MAPRTGSLPYSSPRTTPPSRSLITVLPPASLPHNPPHARSATRCSGYGSPAAFSRGILIPLYPTLAAQMAAIAREYALPSTGGMMLYMVDASPHAGDLARHMIGGPKISEAAWQILWAAIFDEEEGAEAFERELLERDQLYAEPILSPHHQEELLDEETLNSSLEDLARHFPAPPLSLRPSPTREDPPRRTSNTQKDFKLADHLLHHSRSHSSFKTSAPPTRPSHPADPPSRPSSAHSATRPGFRASRRIAIPPARPPAPGSDRASCCSAASSSFRRPPPCIGAGMIVGKIEFDIDCSRSTGRWYEQWLNPSSRPIRSYDHPLNHQNHNNNSNNNHSNNLNNSNNNLNNSHNSNNPPHTAPLSTELSRPLLLPNLITQRSQSAASSDKQPSPTQHHFARQSPPPAERAAPKSIYDNTHSFLAFDDPALPTDGSPRPTPSRQKLPPPTALLPPGDPPGRAFYGRAEDKDQGPPGGASPAAAGRRIVSDRHRQALSLIEAQAKHQALVEQIDAQLSSPIKLDPHAFGPTATTTLPGLSLEVLARPEPSGARYTRAAPEDGCCSTASSPESDPANLTHSSSTTGSSATDSSLDHPTALLLPGLWSNKRSSSVAIEANLKQLEQALVSLSPRALRPGFHALPSPFPAVAAAAPAATPSPDELSQSAPASAASADLPRPGVAAFFDSLQESFNPRVPPPPSPPTETPVGLTAGYARDDRREARAPSSPLPCSPISTPPVIGRANSTTKLLPPRSSSFFRKHHPSPSASAAVPAPASSTPDGFVSKAASIVGKLRAGATPRRRPIHDN
ncbi:hypothetical protein PtB15_1B191 [Puccinia triticina]|nr:hypothetical protein PtB15_1B191 [Puccinia triticina]